MEPLNRRTLLLLSAILIVAIILRAHLLTAKEFGTDEWGTLRLTEQFLEGTFFENASAHGHPPFFFALLAPFWALSDRSVLFVRWVVILLSAVSIFLTFIIARKMFDEDVALLASFLLALSPFHIMYSHHLRSYVFLMVLVLLSLLLAVNYLRKENNRLLVLLAMVYIAAFYSHVFAAFFVVSQILALFVIRATRLRNLRLKPLISTSIITGVSWLLWVPIFISQYRFHSGEGLITQSGIVTLSKINPFHLLYPLYKQAVALDFSSALNGHVYAIFLAAMLVAISFYGGYRLYKTSRTHFILISATAFLPIVLLGVIGFFVAAFSFRYFSYLVPVFFILVANGLMGIRSKTLRVALIITTIIIWFIILEYYWAEFVLYKWGENFAV